MEGKSVSKSNKISTPRNESMKRKQKENRNKIWNVTGNKIWKTTTPKEKTYKKKTNEKMKEM